MYFYWATALSNYFNMYFTVNIFISKTYWVIFSLRLWLFRIILYLWSILLLFFYRIYIFEPLFWQVLVFYKMAMGDNESIRQVVRENFIGECQVGGRYFHWECQVGGGNFHLECQVVGGNFNGECQVDEGNFHWECQLGWGNFNE